MNKPLLKAEDLKAVAASYLPEIRERCGEFETLRQLPQDLAQRLADDGLYQVCTPRASGGLGLGPRSYAEVCELLATADASVGWCAFIAITSGFSMSLGASEELQGLLKTPGVITSGVFAPTAKATPATRDGVDGFVIKGRWQWGSGSRNAHWMNGGTLVAEADGSVALNADGKPDNLAVVFGADEVTMVDTWTVMGLQGTGSGDYEVDGVFVPAWRTFRRTGGRGGEPIHRFPYFAFLSVGVGAVALGAAEAAIKDLQQLASRKVPMGGSRLLADKTSTQLGIARAHAAHRSARAFFYETIDAAWAAAQSGEVGPELRRDLRLGIAHAASASKQAIDIVHELAGGTAVYYTSPIQRRFRDVHVVRQHVMVNSAVFETAGRLLLGLPADDDIF